jgi:hypothetical protein
LHGGPLLLLAGGVGQSHNQAAAARITCKQNAGSRHEISLLLVHTNCSRKLNTIILKNQSKTKQALTNTVDILRNSPAYLVAATRT